MRRARQFQNKPKKIKIIITYLLNLKEFHNINLCAFLLREGRTASKLNIKIIRGMNHKIWGGQVSVNYGNYIKINKYLLREFLLFK